MTSAGALDGHRIVPVVVIDDAGIAAELAAALRDGGIACAEVTLRTPAALDAIRAMAQAPGFTVGAGTVLHDAQVAEVRDAGARFVVSPGHAPALVARVREAGLGVLPGAATASEVLAATRDGLDRVKFFPADRLGGLATIRALAAPFPAMGFVPSGGVRADSAAEYLADPAVPAVSGSWMVPADALRRGDLDEIRRLSAETTAAIGAA